MTVNRNIRIILLFAFLHAFVSILAKVFGFYNELLLTLLTMAMSVMLSMNQRMNPFVTVFWVVIVNFGGVLLGPVLGSSLRKISLSPIFRAYLNSALTTFLVTLLLGVFQYLCSNLIKKSRWYKETDNFSMSGLVIIFCVIMVLRMLRILNNSLDKIVDNIILNISLDYMVSCGVVFYIARYALKADKKIAKEKEKRNLAQFSYARLKQQIEPHFLFNTLNTLDGLVCDEKTEQASLFIHKLSSIYRYMIENENEHIIYLREDIKFAQKYIDLLSVRFTEGFKVNINISDSDQMRSVVPCALQILVENATKHNVIMPDNPLILDIYVDNGWITASNSLHPKKTSQTSTEKGLKYLSQQYKDVSGKDIQVIKGQDSFVVKLPLL